MKKYFVLFIFLSLVHSFNVYSQDKLEALRTGKQIITMDGAKAPYFSIQVLALKNPPSDAAFFAKLDRVKEYPCGDGFVRYCVGDYETASQANLHLDAVKAMGYPEAFVVYTKRLGVSGGDGSFSAKELVIDPNGSYLIQLSAFRFPVYISFFKEFDQIYEFRMNDNIYRYTIPSISGTLVNSELVRIQQLGYKDAFIVESDRYMPFKIE